MSERPQPATKEGRGIRGWIFILGWVLLGLFLVLNLQEVEVDLIIAEVKMPLIIALGIAAVLGALIAMALPRLRGRRTE